MNKGKENDEAGILEVLISMFNKENLGSQHPYILIHPHFLYVNTKILPTKASCLSHHYYYHYWLPCDSAAL